MAPGSGRASVLTKKEAILFATTDSYYCRPAAGPVERIDPVVLTIGNRSLPSNRRQTIMRPNVRRVIKLSFFCIFYQGPASITNKAPGIFLVSVGKPFDEMSFRSGPAFGRPLAFRSTSGLGNLAHLLA